jgi:hypothetical protein
VDIKPSELLDVDPFEVRDVEPAQMADVGASGRAVGPAPHREWEALALRPLSRATGPLGCLVSAGSIGKHAWGSLSPFGWPGWWPALDRFGKVALQTLPP